MGEYAPFLFSGAQAGASLLTAQGQEAEAGAAAAAARYNAEQAKRAGYSEEARIRREGVRTVAMRRTDIAKSGLAAEGTSLAALVADAATVERAALEARQAGLDTAKLERSSASAATRTGRQAALGTILSGAGQAGALYYGLTRPRLTRY